jgi:nicotinamide riboside transporter PnuC
MQSNQNRSTHFYNLTYQEQIDTVWRQGKPLQTRRIPDFWIHLYAVDALFVELWICQRHYDVMVLRVLSTTNELEPYLQLIQLSLHELLP